MNLSETQTNILFIFIIILLLAANVYVRKIKADRTPLGRVVGLLSDINKNKKLMESSGLTWQSRLFRTTKWKKSQRKVDFLPQGLRDKMSEVFLMADEANEKIAQARRNKSGVYLSGVNIDRMKEPVNNTREALGSWLRENYTNPAYFPRRKSLFGGLFRR